MMWGGIIMIIGVVIQVAAVKGHKATAQFVIGRIITGVGNGMVSTTAILLFKSSLTKFPEHFHHSNLPGRVFPLHQPRSPHLYRGRCHRHRYYDRLLDRLRRLLLRA